MKTSILAVAAALAVATALPAAAQTATGNVAINGSVGDRCQFTLPSDVINAGELSQQGSGSNAGKLDPSKLDGQTRTLQGWCNGTAATMSVEALLTRRMDFVKATDTSVTDGAGTSVPVGMFTGDVQVTLSNSSSPTAGLLVAGDYSGQVLVTLTPSVTPAP